MVAMPMMWNFVLSASLYKVTCMVESNLTATLRRTRTVSKFQKLNLKIDMTPMVDLGFLLIAFFILTTKLSEPAVMKLYMPHDGSVTKVADSKSLTVLLAGNDRIFYYFGQELTAIKEQMIQQTSYDEMKGIGSLIRTKQNILQLTGSKLDLVILIKPTPHCTYRNVVAALDECLSMALPGILSLRRTPQN